MKESGLLVIWWLLACDWYFQSQVWHECDCQLKWHGMCDMGVTKVWQENFLGLNDDAQSLDYNAMATYNSDNTAWSVTNIEKLPTTALFSTIFFVNYWDISEFLNINDTFNIYYWFYIIHTLNKCDSHCYLVT